MTDVLPEIPDQLQLDADGRIGEDLPCLRCGYNLRGLDPGGRCPECGTAVGRSAHGDLLRFCDPLWVHRLASGMNWIVAGIACAILSSLVVSIVSRATAAAGVAGSQLMPVLVNWAVSAVTLMGYWRLTTPDPSKPAEENKVSARSLARWTQVATFALAPVCMSLMRSHPLTGGTIAVISGVIGLVGMFAIFIYVRRLALRIPDERLARHTFIVMWGIVVTSLFALLGMIIVLVSLAGGAPASGGLVIGAGGGVGCLVLVGYLVFGLWSIWLIERYRKALREAAMTAIATWARSSEPVRS